MQRAMPLIIILAVLALAGAYFAWATVTKIPQYSLGALPSRLIPAPSPFYDATFYTPPDTRNWKTYKNITNAYSFKYPPEATIKESPIADFYFLDIFGFGASIGVAPTGKYTDRPAFGKDSVEKTQKYVVKIGGSEVEGEEAIIVDGRSIILEPLSVNGYDFFISFGRDDKARIVVATILSTFKFTE